MKNSRVKALELTELLARRLNLLKVVLMSEGQLSNEQEEPTDKFIKINEAFHLHTGMRCRWGAVDWGQYVGITLTIPFNGNGSELTVEVVDDDSGTLALQSLSVYDFVGVPRTDKQVFLSFEMVLEQDLMEGHRFYFLRNQPDPRTWQVVEDVMLAMCTTQLWDDQSRKFFSLLHMCMSKV